MIVFVYITIVFVYITNECTLYTDAEHRHLEAMAFQHIKKPESDPETRDPGPGHALLKLRAAVAAESKDSARLSSVGQGGPEGHGVVGVALVLGFVVML